MNLTKTLLPKPLHVLERDRLLNRLLTWEDRKLVILHGQAGQGKSTLAAHYARSLKTPVVWYTMDQDDENPALFLSCLGQAVQRAFPSSQPAAVPLIQNQFAANSQQGSISAWASQVFSSLPGPGLVVFDDFIVTPASLAMQQILKTLIETTPPQVRFMIISRMRPELGIAKLRATQAVGELTSDDLRFTDQEVMDLFSIVFSMHISPTEAALINSTAEGWPAGLTLMHEYLSALAPEARATAIIDRTAAGFRTHVFDYLAQEVFTHLPPALQTFLLKTSIADYLPVPLMELLTGLPQKPSSRKPSVSMMMNELRARNLFVAAMDDAGTIFRYHALFREFLRKKLVAQTRPLDVKKLYTIAANYFKTAGQPVPCVDLYLASGQFVQAIREMESSGEELIACGRTGTLIRWVETLPLEYGNRPWPLFYRAIACRFTDPRTALTFFELAFKGFRAERTSFHRIEGQIYSLCGIIETCFHTGGNFSRMGRAAILAQKLLAQSRRASSSARARLLLAMGMAWFFIGRLQQSSDALKQALGLFRKQGDHFYQITCAIYLTPCALYQGDFRLAREAVRKGQEALVSIPDETGGRAALFLVEAMVLLFEGNFAEAQERLDRCRNLAGAHALESLMFLSLDIGGWLMIAQGDHQGAELLLSECKRKGEETQNEFFSASAAHLLAIAYLFQGRLEQAKRESDYALSIRTQSGSRLFHAIYLIASGAIHMKLGQHTKAEKELLRALKMLQQIKAAHQEANAHLMLASLYRKVKKTDRARKHLNAGFSMGRERGFTYYALFTSSELTELANAAIEQDVCVDYCIDLLDNRARGNNAPLLKVLCLGGFRVMRDKTPVRDGEWKSKRAKTLFKLLVAQTGQKLPRERAMEMLWPDSRSDSLRMTFNAMLHRLRKALAPKEQPGKDIFCIHQQGDLIALNSRQVWTDVEQFLLHLETANAMKADQKPETVLEEYEKALSLYRGDFLPDDLYSDWATPMREQLRAQYLRALESAAGLALTSGDQDRALAFHEKMFLADPCNEKACCWLMTQYRSLARRGEAIRIYERCERALSRDMDLEPEEQTRKLYRSIIGG